MILEENNQKTQKPIKIDFCPPISTGTHGNGLPNTLRSFSYYFFPLLYTTIHCVKTLQVAGKDWEFPFKILCPPLSTKTSTEVCIFFMLAATRVLSACSLVSEPTVLYSFQRLLQTTTVGDRDLS